MSHFLRFDLAPLVALSATSVTLAVLGSFLLLRRQALFGDALSHAVLPGLVVAWLVTGSRDAGPMFVGALGAGLVAALAVGAVRRAAHVEGGAALGVVFTTLFALGVLLIETTGARRIDLDVDCVLSGQPELLLWLAARSPGDLFVASTWASLPRPVPVTLSVLALTLAFVAWAWRPLRAATFDPRFASAVGAAPATVSVLLYALTSTAVVAGFEAIGTILVVGLLVTPAATARLLTDDLRHQVFFAAALALAGTWAGYLVATRAAPALGLGALDVAGTIATTGGVGLGLAVAWPRRDSVRSRPVTDPMTQR